MNELFTTLGKLIAALGSTQSVNAVKEHLALARTQHDLLMKRVGDLENECSKLNQENQSLKNQLSHELRAKQYTEYRGALFERDAGGLYSDTPLCPNCFTVMISFQGIFPFQCGNSKCNQRANLIGNDLPCALKYLQNQS